MDRRGRGEQMVLGFCNIKFSFVQSSGENLRIPVRVLVFGATEVLKPFIES